MRPLRSTENTSPLQRGIAAARSGRPTEARKLLQQVTDTDPANEMAWLWLSSLMITDEQKRSCLIRVLRINPDNAYARAGLARLLGIPWFETDELESRLASVTSGSAPRSPRIDSANGTTLPTELAPKKGRSTDHPQSASQGRSGPEPVPSPESMEVTCPSCDRRVSPTVSKCPYCYLPFRPLDELLGRDT